MASSPEDEKDDESDEDTEMEPTGRPSPPAPRGPSIPATALAKPPDQGLGIASHRGHVNSATNVHEAPFGLGASISLIQGGRSGTVLERVKRGKASRKGDRWEMEMSGNVTLKTVRKDVTPGRTRRGLRSEDLVAKARHTDGDETSQEDEGSGPIIHELEEDALLRLCPIREEPPTPQMPQLDKEDLDKLIAPPLAWDGFQKQKMMQEAGQNLTLDQRLAIHSGMSRLADIVQSPSSVVAPKENNTNQSAEQSTSFANADSHHRESANTMASALNSMPSTLYATPAEMGERQVLPTMNSSARQRPMSTDNRSYWLGGGGGTLGDDIEPSPSSFVTSSTRTSAIPVGPVALVPQSALAEVTPEPDPASRDFSTPSSRFRSSIDSQPSVSRPSTSEAEPLGRLREDGTWVPSSMNTFTNQDRLRNREPYDDLGLASVQLSIPLPRKSMS